MFKLVVDSALEEVVFAFDPMDEALIFIVTSGCLCDAFVIVGIKECLEKFLAVFFGLFFAFVTIRFVRLYIFRSLVSVGGCSGIFISHGGCFLRFFIIAKKRDAALERLLGDKKIANATVSIASVAVRVTCYGFDGYQ